jgi:hypothetical protein
LGPNTVEGGFGCVKRAQTTSIFPDPLESDLSTDRAARGGKRSAHLQQLELELRRDIAEAFFNAHTPIEVYRLALTRVTPLVNATFASVFLRDEAEPELLRLVCAHSWPQASARHLSQMHPRGARADRPRGGRAGSN